MKKTRLFLTGFLFFFIANNANASTLTLRPWQAGDESQLTAVGCSTNFHNVLDTTSDDDTSYNRSNSTSYKYDLYNLSDSAYSGAINSLTVYIRTRCESLDACVAKTRIKTGGTTFLGSEIIPATTYTLYSTTYTTNPNTTVAWTWDDIINLQAGAGLRGWVGGDTAGYRARITQLYVTVDYTYSTTTTNNTTTTVNVCISSSSQNIDEVTAIGSDGSYTVYTFPFFDFAFFAIMTIAVILLIWITFKR